MKIYMLVVLLIALAGLGYAFYNFFKVKSLSEGDNEDMVKIAKAIRQGADTFLLKEYKVLAFVIVALAVIFSIFIQLSSAISFIIGTVMSGLAGLLGMKMSTLANVRVTNTAKETKNIHKTLLVALRGGSVMGLSVSVFALIGLTIVYFLFSYQMNDFTPIINIFGISFTKMSMTFSTYALGCSVIAMFNRVGGGIYTKAADMGADLVGKTEMNIPEDDRRNPATIADCVGDNVGDTAGLGSDLLESYMGAITSAVILTIFLYTRYSNLGMNFSYSFFEKLMFYPIGFCALGLVACMLGLAFVFLMKNSKDPHRTLNIGTWISAGLTAVFGFVFTYVFFSGETIGDLPFKFGIYSPYVSNVLGILAGILLGAIAEYYTSYEYNPTKDIAASSKEGPALTITEGLAKGMKSTLLSVVVLAIVIMIAYTICGILGIALAAVGMLSFVGITVSVDTYGPISDNAGGIAEMAHLDKSVREITDMLDSVGNTTAAIGKGFAIGSAAYAATGLMISYLYSYTAITEEVKLDLMNPYTLAGTLIGAAATFYFSGLLIEAVAKSARKMVDEVRRQFQEIKGLKEGKTDPDYVKCIGIATEGALSEMKAPAFISLLVPVVSGFILGPNFVAGILIGATIAAIMLAIFTGNAGGAWDNAKKYIESLGEKGTPQHSAAVVGDTVGDPLKDTVGPSLDILIKIMSTISLIMVPLFFKYNLIDFLSGLFK